MDLQDEFRANVKKVCDAFETAQTEVILKQSRLLVHENLCQLNQIIYHPLILAGRKVEKV